MRRLLWRSGQAVIGAALFAALFYFGLIDLNALALAANSPGVLAVTVALAFLAFLCAGYRWHIMLLSQGLVLRAADTLRIHLIATFFSTFIPGSAGADLIRGAYAFRATKTKRTTAVFSLLLDHLIGLCGFLLVGLAAVFLRRATSPVDLALAAMTAAMLSGLVVMLLFGHQLARLVAKFLPFGETLRGVLDQIAEALERYAKSPATVAASLLFSVVIAAASVAGIYVLALSIGLDRLGYPEYALAYVYASIARLLPVTPSGIGIGEGAFAAVCLALDPVVQPYAAVFLVFRVVVIVASVPGVLLYWLRPQGVSFEAGHD